MRSRPHTPGGVWSPDGSRYAVQAGNSGVPILIVDRSGAQAAAIPLPSDVGNVVGGPTWSPDGRSLAIVGCSPNPCDGSGGPNVSYTFWIVAVDGSPARSADRTGPAPARARELVARRHADLLHEHRTRALRPGVQSPVGLGPGPVVPGPSSALRYADRRWFDAGDRLAVGDDGTSRMVAGRTAHSLSDERCRRDLPDRDGERRWVGTSANQRRTILSTPCRSGQETAAGSRTRRRGHQPRRPAPTLMFGSSGPMGAEDAWWRLGPWPSTGSRVGDQPFPTTRQSPRIRRWVKAGIPGCSRAEALHADFDTDRLSLVRWEHFRRGETSSGP